MITIRYAQRLKWPDHYKILGFGTPYLININVYINRYWSRWCIGLSVRLIVERPGFDSLVESDQKT